MYASYLGQSELLFSFHDNLSSKVRIDIYLDICPFVRRILLFKHRYKLIMMNLQKEKTQPVINTHSMAEEAATEGF